MQCIFKYENKLKLVEKVMHSFEVHSNESARRKKVRLGLEQVLFMSSNNDYPESNFSLFQPLYHLYIQVLQKWLLITMLTLLFLFMS